jgi:hypothetical protein
LSVARRRCENREIDVDRGCSGSRHRLRVASFRRALAEIGVRDDVSPESFARLERAAGVELR